MIWALTAFLILAADQMTKFLVAANANVGDVLGSVPGLEIMYVKNTGAAFSVMAGKVSFLTVISVAFCIAAVVYWIKKKPSHPLMCISLVMMFSGALGNAIDRVVRGFVVDFIRVTFVNFPVFNIADIGITVGALLLVVYVIFFDKSEEKNK